jgi:CRISPR/Cas system CSM-associated protein Csm2 small subunit
LDYLVKKMDANNEQHLNDFKQFMEAIVAYRKYVGNDK